MNIKEFISRFYEIKDEREKQISDIFSILSNFEQKIKNYDEQNIFDKKLINILLNHSIIISISNIQWFLEDLLELVENYIVKNNIKIDKLNKKIYNLYYKKYNNDIIRDFLVYWENLFTKDLWIFIDRNKFENVILKSWTSNTINFSTIKEMLSIILLDINFIINNIEIEVWDYNDFIDKRIWNNYILKEKHKLKFYKKMLDQLSVIRNEIAHWKILNENDILYIYKLFNLNKKYFYSKFLLELSLFLKKSLIENRYFKK